MSLYPPVSSTESFIVDVQEFINRINELIMLFFMYLLSVTFLTFFFLPSLLNMLNVNFVLSFIYIEHVSIIQVLVS